MNIFTGSDKIQAVGLFWQIRTVLFTEVIKKSVHHLLLTWQNDYPINPKNSNPHYNSNWFSFPFRVWVYTGVLLYYLDIFSLKNRMLCTKFFSKKVVCWANIYSNKTMQSLPTQVLTTTFRFVEEIFSAKLIKSHTFQVLF